MIFSRTMLRHVHLVFSKKSSTARDATGLHLPKPFPPLVCFLFTFITIALVKEGTHYLDPSTSQSVVGLPISIRYYRELIFCYNISIFLDRFFKKRDRSIYR